MSCYKCKKLIISEEERKDILFKYGILNEITTPIDLATLRVGSRGFFANGKWKNLKSEAQVEFDSDWKNVTEFLKKWNRPGFIIEVYIEASESRVTNYDREVEPKVFLKPGVLSQRRADTLKNILNAKFDELLKDGVISKKPIIERVDVKIGKTPYVRGKSDPKAAVYDKERYVMYTLKAVREKDAIIPSEIPTPEPNKPPTEITTTEDCLTNLKIQIVYKKDAEGNFTRGSTSAPKGGYVIRTGCCGYHKCDDAVYDVLLNGVVIGVANLNNGSRTARETSTGTGDSKESPIFSISKEQANQILSKGNRVLLSLNCKKNVCHSDAPGYIIYNNDKIISSGCAPIQVRVAEENKDKPCFIPGEVKMLYIDNCGTKINPPDNPIIDAKPRDEWG